ncbi:MAG: hypothetical protein WDN26_15875 [Chitinophagaceae bacterium]
MKEYNRLTDEEKDALYKNFLQEPESFYEKAATDQLKNDLNKSHKERFLTMTRLMKVNFMLSNAKITYGKHPSNKND